MSRALALAAPMVGRTGDNPAVGCVIALGDAVLGEGVTAEGGRPHAEEAAIAAAGGSAPGATVYVTLEPCAKRTSGAASCSDRLIQAGITRIVIATGDPHPFANGIGADCLCAAGVTVVTGVLEAEARAMNAAFFARWDKP